MIQQAKDLLSFKAFKPSKQDIKVPLYERFNKAEPFMGVLLSNNLLTLSEIQYKSAYEVSVSHIKNFSVNSNEDIVKYVATYSKGNKLSHVLLLSSPGIQVLKFDYGLPKKGINRLYDVKHLMGDVLSEPIEEGRTYAYTSRNQSSESLVFSYDEIALNAYSSLINDAGLEIVRASCGIYTTFDYLFNENTKFFEIQQILFILCGNALIMGSIVEGRLQQLSFRNNLDNKDFQCHIQRMIERFEFNHDQISYLNCSDWDFEMHFNRIYPNLKRVPIFESSYEGVFQSACYG